MVEILFLVVLQLLIATTIVFLYAILLVSAATCAVVIFYGILWAVNKVLEG